jgi:hypothetical protein
LKLILQLLSLPISDASQEEEKFAQGKRTLTHQALQQTTEA